MSGLRELLDQLDALRADAHDGPWERNETWARWVDDEDGSLVAEAQSPADAALIVAAVNALPKLTAALRAGLAEHRPMANSPGRVPACPDCLGGIYADDPDAARSCGCWGLSTPVCSSCADRDGARLHPVQWPCPTVQAVTTALTPEVTP